MSILYEYFNTTNVVNRNELERLLKEVWNQELFENFEEDIITEVESKSNYQPFLTFDGNEVKANNYVGFIKSGEDEIEIYPKVFKHQPNLNKSLMLRHMFLWFGYCRKWNFPFLQERLDSIDIDNFPELIIHLMAKQIYDTVNALPFSMYAQFEEPLITPRGSINFSRYALNQLSKGNFHKIECDYEPFVYNNKVNQVIKYCARLLLGQTKFTESMRFLQDTVFILDDVEDTFCTLVDLNKIRINGFFEEYIKLLDTCKLILNHQLYSHNIYDLSQWCILFPMEYLFEDFIAGFLEQKFSNNWRIEYQKSDMCFSSMPKAFKMKHDIFLTNKSTGKNIIVDTKYKLRQKKDNKKGIDQTDLYQVVSYAYRRGCNDVFLIYPNLTEQLDSEDTFIVESGFQGQDKITVKAFEVPFWSLNEFDSLEQKLYDTLCNNLS